MLGVLRSALCLVQAHRGFEIGDYTRHSKRQESMLRLFKIPAVDHRRRRVVVRLWGERYLAIYYVTNAARYARWMRSEELGSNLQHGVVRLHIKDIWPHATNVVGLLSMLNYDVSNILDRIGVIANTDFTLLRYKRLSTKYTNTHCIIYADQEEAVVIKLPE